MNKTKEQFDNNAKSPCRKQPRLLPVIVKETVRLGRGHSVMMVETSGRGRLTGRQSCAVESAARRCKTGHKYFILLSCYCFRSGMAVNVVLLSPQLNLTDNTTCQLVNSDLSINFYTIDIESSTRGTPLGVFNINK